MTNTPECKASIQRRVQYTQLRSRSGRILNRETIIDKQVEHSGETSVLSLRNIRFLSSPAEDLPWTGIKDGLLEKC